MASTKPKVLVILSSAATYPNSSEPTGWYLPEFAHPYEVLSEKCEIVVASPKGGKAPLDPSSVEAFKNDDGSQKFLKEHADLWENTHKLSEFVGHADEFAAIFYVGGHGPMFDLATDEQSHQLIKEFHEKNKIISAVCHGPAALAHVKLADGSYLIANQEITALSNSEEEAGGHAKSMPFELETDLNKNSGGKFTKNPQNLGPKVVVANNGKLITGQNPASGAGVGRALYDSIFGESTAGKVY